MWKVILIILIIAAFGGYYWYVRGVDLAPLLQKAASVRIHVTFEEATPVPEIEQDTSRGTWEVLVNMPSSRTEVAVAALNNEIFVIGGLDGFGRTVATVEIFDAKENNWSSFSPLPEKKHHASAVTANGELYVIGGFSGLNFQPSDLAWKLNREEKTWEEVADIPEPLGAMAAVSIRTSGNKQESIYTFGGSGQGISRAVYRYDTKLDSWEKRKNMPTPREHLAAGVIDNKIYVVGGREKSLTRNLDDLEIYIPSKNIWAIGPSMITARGGIAASAIHGKLYVFGGEHPVGTFDETEVYDPDKKEWDTLNPMPSGRHGLGAAAVDGSIYVIAGGKRPLLSVSGANEKFTPPEQIQTP